VKNGKVQVYCILGSKVSSVVAEHLEQFVARPDPGASQADLCPSNRPLRPPHSPGFSLEAPSLIPICTQSRFKRVPQRKQKMQTEPHGIVCCRVR
jgi:hypothetical protein